MASALARRAVRIARVLPAQTRAFTQTPLRKASAAPTGPELDPELANDVNDPGMNGGYINPPREKRQFRDPYGDWWYKQQRRNYGEPVHEDDDVLGMFTPEEYTWTTPGKGALLFGTFVLAYAGILGAVLLTYPDKPSVPKSYPGGLDVELGGKGALRARQDSDAEGVRAVSNI